MKLAVFERVMLFNILPREGDFTTAKIVRKLREDLSLSEKEQKEINFRNGDEPGSLAWDKQVYKEVVIGEKAMDLIASSLKKAYGEGSELSKAGKVTPQHIALYERFVGDE